MKTKLRSGTLFELTKHMIVFCKSANWFDSKIISKGQTVMYIGGIASEPKWVHILYKNTLYVIKLSQFKNLTKSCP